MNTIILDLNGVLIRKIYKKEYKEHTELFRKETLNSDVILIRKDLEDFLATLFSRYRVGIYTSTTQAKSQKILDLILTPNQQSSLVCFLSRDHTILDPDGEHAYSTIKSIKYISITYNIPLEKIVIIDDDSSKIRKISPKNKIVIGKKDMDNETYFENILNVIQKMISSKK